MDRGSRLRFSKVATQNRAPTEPAHGARSRPRGGSFRRRVVHQARIVPCGASLVGIRTAGDRPERTKWRHTPSGRVRLHTPPDRLGARRWHYIFCLCCLCFYALSSLDTEEPLRAKIPYRKHGGFQRAVGTQQGVAGLTHGPFTLEEETWSHHGHGHVHRTRMLLK